MTSRKGGYIIIDLTSTTLVDDLAIALKSNKPVLVYNADDEANYFTLSYDSVSKIYTLTGAKDSYSVASDGTITPIVPTETKYYRTTFTDNGTLPEGYVYKHKAEFEIISTESFDDEDNPLTFSKLQTAYRRCGLQLDGISIITYNDTDLLVVNAELYNSTRVDLTLSNGTTINVTYSTLTVSHSKEI